MESSRESGRCFRLLLCCIITFTVDSSDIPWSWDTVRLQTLFSTWTERTLSDYQAQFIATHYDIITVGSCLGTPTVSGVPTETVFYEFASQLRQYSTSTDTKILFYFASDICYWNCYSITDSFYQNDSMHLRDDNGTILLSNAFPYYDHLQQSVRDWWVQTLIDVITTAKQQYNITINGLFIDGILRQFGSSIMSSTRETQYAEAIVSLLVEMKAALSLISDDTFLFGCCMDNYNHMMDLYPYLDGVMFEHYGSFEFVDTDGKYKPNEILGVFDIAKSFGGNTNKSLLIKAWIGPETSPFRDVPFGPTWPNTYGEIPPTLQELQNPSQELISYPLATYLCGIYNKYVYFGYTYWYDLNEGVVPCPDDPTICSCPSDWYQEFVNQLGKPLSDGMLYDTYKCNRSFENADVYVDINDPTSAQIHWLTAVSSVDPTTREPSVDPTSVPSVIPTLDPTNGPIVMSTVTNNISVSNDAEKKDADSPSDHTTVKITMLSLIFGLMLICGCGLYIYYRRATKEYEQIASNITAQND